MPYIDTIGVKIGKIACTVDSRYSLIANSGKTRISGFFQITKTKMNFM